MAARIAPAPVEPHDALFAELEAIFYAHGFRAAHGAIYDALKRLAEDHRDELTARGWII